MPCLAFAQCTPGLMAARSATQVGSRASTEQLEEAFLALRQQDASEHDSMESARENAVFMGNVNKP